MYRRRGRDPAITGMIVTFGPLNCCWPHKWITKTDRMPAMRTVQLIILLTIQKTRKNFVTYQFRSLLADFETNLRLNYDWLESDGGGRWRWQRETPNTQLMYQNVRLIRFGAVWFYSRSYYKVSVRLLLKIGNEWTDQMKRERCRRCMVFWTVAAIVLIDE